jgi:hypothetical protein
MSDLSDSEKTNYRRYESLANRLNKDAYHLQSEAHRWRPLAHFNPCAKALVLTLALSKRPIPVTMEVIPIAAITICACHQGMSENDLYNLFFATESA